jgi:hypothetical protein
VMGRERRGCVREGERNYVPTQTYRSFPLAGLRQVKDKMGNMSITVFKVKTHRVSFLKRGDSSLGCMFSTFSSFI